MRGAWIDQHLDAYYSGGPLTAPLISNNSIKFKGGGLRTGFDTTWTFGCSFGLLARTNVDILWSKFNVNQTTNQNSGLGPVRDVFRDSIQAFTPIVELFLGVIWEKILCNTYYVNAHIGWEEQYFFNMIQWNAFTSGAGPDLIASVRQKGSLGLSGLTAGVTFGF